MEKNNNNDEALLPQEEKDENEGNTESEEKKENSEKKEINDKNENEEKKQNNEEKENNEKNEKNENNENNENINIDQISIQKLNDDEKQYDKSIKVIFLGDTNVGKSSVINRLKNNSFNKNQQQTFTLEHYNLIIKINSYILRMQIWDTAGQEKFDSITSTYYKSTDVAIFVYAINSKESFERIPGWIKELEEQNTSNKNEEEEEQITLKLLIGNKADLENERKITYEEGKTFSKDNGFSLFTEISCKEDQEKKNDKKFENILEVIGKEFYKLKESRERLNSSSYNYEASQSLLDSKNPNDKSCHC